MATHLQARARIEKRVYIVPILLVVVGSIAMFLAANVDRCPEIPKHDSVLIVVRVLGLNSSWGNITVG